MRARGAKVTTSPCWSSPPTTCDSSDEEVVAHSARRRADRSRDQQDRRRTRFFLSRSLQVRAASEGLQPEEWAARRSSPRSPAKTQKVSTICSRRSFSSPTSTRPALQPEHGGVLPIIESRLAMSAGPSRTMLVHRGTLSRRRDRRRRLVGQVVLSTLQERGSSTTPGPGYRFLDPRLRTGRRRPLSSPRRLPRAHRHATTPSACRAAAPGATRTQRSGGVSLQNLFDHMPGRRVADLKTS